MAGIDAEVREIRSFNRFYTRFVGALDEGHLGSEYTLADVRVHYEIAHSGGLTATEIGDRLALDAGYLSRILKRFERKGLVAKTRCDDDRRAARLRRTAEGEQVFAALDCRAVAEVEKAVAHLSPPDLARLTSSMSLVRRLLGETSGKGGHEVQLREPRPGDFGWAVERHGSLYAEGYGWGMLFEGLVAELFGKFARGQDPARERCWIAELDGRRVGCVFVVAREPDVAQLRCLLVEPGARGHGVGSRLVEACLSFAREAGYKKMMLWTNDVLVSARRIYEAAGFRLIAEEKHRDFGPELTGQTWEADL